HGTFYLYFQNKRDAFSQVMTDICQRMYEEAELSWDGDPSEAVVGGVRSFFQVFAEHRGLWRALVEGALQDPVIEATWVDLRRPFVDRLERLLEHLVAAGSIPPLDTVVAAPALGSMVEWFAFTHFVLGQPPESEVGIDRAARGVAEVWMRSVFASDQASTTITSSN
ncbi:MAG TPA: TetR/AcrR family transcriptional regulator C-terminal domain-containing protein, partial [Acidimicrobiales bacterium]|nr:TetR/AcrR family transcriptional regulator C-terminal domain-containing protein [Acidimicrobiales bacterium]